MTGRTHKGLQRWVVPGTLLLILLVAAGLRLWRLDDVPPGPSHDEANNGLMAGEVLKGYHPVFFEIYTGVEPGLIYPQALAFWLFGKDATVQRLVSVAFGLLTVLLTYVFAAHLFQSRAVGLISTLLIAISFWHLFVSRLALRAVVMPPLQILTLLFFWRAMEERRLRDFVLAGLFGGLTMYSYLSSRFLPLVLILFVCYLLLRRATLRGLWWRLGVMVIVWVLVFLPLGVYYLNNPDWFLLRAEQALIFSRPGAESALPPVLQQTLATLGMFSFKGDPSWRYNLAGRPVFDWAMALAFYGGIALSLVRSAGKPKLNPYAFLLLTQVVMLVPDFITDGSPHFLRTIGAVPTTYIFPAIALVELGRRLEARWPRWRWGLVAAMVAWALFSGWSTAHDYFGTWAHNAEAREIYSAAYTEMGDYLQDQPLPGEALIASTSPDLDRVAFDLSVGETNLPVRWFDASQALVFPQEEGTQDHYYLPSTIEIAEPLRALIATVDAKQIPAPDGSPSFTILPIPLASQPQIPVDAVVGDLVHIVGYDLLTSDIQAGQPLDIRLHWEVAVNPDPRRKWTWFVHLVDARGYMWANANAQGVEVADWRPGDRVVQHLSLYVPFDGPDIAYQLQVGIFDQISGERLTDSAGMDHVLLQGVRIRPTDIESVAGIIAAHGKERLGEKLVFLGSTLSTKEVAPGQSLVVTLAWSPLVTLSTDYAFEAQLLGEDGSLLLQHTWVPLDGEYPTGQWLAERIVRDVLRLPIPEGTRPGQVRLVVSAVGLSGSASAGAFWITP
jgi:4-amino-4-deoxy-L-arabinose transferase-like glycosyltransferase